MMEIPGWLVLLALATVIVVILVARWISKYNIFVGRKPLSLEEIYQQEAALLGVDYKIFEQVFNVVGRAYRIDPTLLRPYDKLQIFFDLDSWELGEGTEEINEWLEKNFGITHFKAEPKTIAEFIVAIKNSLAHKENGPEGLQIHSKPQ